MRASDADREEVIATWVEMVMGLVEGNEPGVPRVPDQHDYQAAQPKNAV